MPNTFKHPWIENINYVNNGYIFATNAVTIPYGSNEHSFNNYFAQLITSVYRFYVKIYTDVSALILNYSIWDSGTDFTEYALVAQFIDWIDAIFHASYVVPVGFSVFLLELNPVQVKKS